MICAMAGQSGCAFEARCNGFETSQKSKFHALTRETIDHGISIVKASELPNQGVVDAFVHGDRGPER